MPFTGKRWRKEPERVVPVPFLLQKSIYQMEKQKENPEATVKIAASGSENDELPHAYGNGLTVK